MLFQFPIFNFQLLPAINATLNATSGILLFSAWIAIKRKKITLHKRLMLSACTASLVFLACYVLNHYLRHGVVTRFRGTGGIRVFYLAMLTTHTLLAVAIVPMAVMSVYNGLKMRVAEHRRIAKWTFPLWMYVSVTGVLVYFFLYQWFPSG